MSTEGRVLYLPFLLSIHFQPSINQLSINPNIMERKMPELPDFCVSNNVELCARRLISSVMQSRKTQRNASKIIAVAVATILTLGTSIPDVNAQSATYYHPSLAGRTMANGKPYRPHRYTAATNHYRLGTRLKVTNRRNGKSVIVVVTDRCGACSIDLSSAAFKAIANKKTGRVPVRVKPI